MKILRAGIIDKKVKRFICPSCGEQIISLNKQEMVKFITDCTNMCEYCPCSLVCMEGVANTKCTMLLKWLDSEGNLDDYMMEVE